jgi:hypothetical protein
MALDQQVEQAFEEGVIRLKSEGFSLGVITLLDQILLKLVVTWGFAPKKIDSLPPSEIREDPWKAVKVDLAGWADLAGLSTQQAEEGYLRLKALGALYPDGTYPPEVEMYVVEKAYGLLGEPVPGEGRGHTTGHATGKAISDGKLH